MNLGIQNKKVQLQDQFCLSDCRDLRVGTVNLMEVYVNGELMSWFGFFSPPFFSLPLNSLLQVVRPPL